MQSTQVSNSKPSVYLQNMDQVRKVFNRFDANGDGKISSDEFIAVLKALGSDASPDAVSRMMKEINTNEDGSINLQEFASFCSADADPYDGNGEKELKEAFQVYDQDHDGGISTSELHKVLTRIGESCSEKDCDGMIQSVDSDGDGCVSYDEFRNMMSNNTK